MFHATIKHLAARKLRLLTTGVAVMLGVAFMAGTLVLTDTIERTFDDLYADVNAGTDAYVRGETAFSSELGDQRARLDASLVEVVAAVDGVAVAEPTVQSYAQLVDPAGEPVGDPAGGAPTLGMIWSETDELNPFTLAEGRAPMADDEIAIDRSSATSAGFTIGDTATVLTRSGSHQLRIVGVATFGSTDSPAGASVVLFTPATAQALVTGPGTIDGISVVADDGTSQATVTDQIRSAVPTGTEVLTGAELTEENQAAAQDGMSMFKTFLVSFAAIALFVGSFIIYNTFSILVAQRSKEHALLRALGASRRQVLRSVLLEAGLVGVVASGVGLAAGLGVASGLQALLEHLGFDLPPGGMVVSANTIAVSLVAGVVVSIASAVFPARRAARVPPVAAMRDLALEMSSRSRARAAMGVATTVAGAGTLAAGLFAGAGIAAIGGGAVLVFLGVAVLGPIVARPLSRLIGAPLPRLAGLPGNLARENAMRNPKRTSTTAAALMVGVALVAFITVLASSTKASFDAAIGSAFTGDFVVDSGARSMGGFDPQLAASLGDLPEVRAVTGLRATQARIEGSTLQVYGADARTVGDVFDFGAVTGSFDDLGAGEIAVFADEARARGLELGDEVEVTFAETGTQQLSVAATYAEDDLVGDYWVGLDAFEANVADQLDVKVFVSTAPGVDAAQARSAITAAASAYPQAEVQDADEFAGAQTAPIDQMLTLVYALLALAIVIALIGIANTLALSVLERTRELGLLRAVGMTRRQIRAVIRWEAVIIALLGTGMGLAVGLGFGWAVVEAMSGQGVTVLRIPGGQLAVITVLAALAGVGAAVLPARRAARLDVLRAIGTS